MEEKHYASSDKANPKFAMFWIVRFNDCVMHEWRAAKPAPLDITVLEAVAKKANETLAQAREELALREAELEQRKDTPEAEAADAAQQLAAEKAAAAHDKAQQAEAALQSAR